MKWFRIFLSILFISALLIPSIVSADTSLALFSVVESDGTNHTMLPIIASIDNTSLVNQGKIAADGLNTQVTLNGTAVPHMVADNKTLFASAIGADSTNSFVYSSKSPPDTSMPIIVGDSGYIRTPYNINLELEDPFEIVISGYVDTTSGVDKYILFKDGEASIQVTGSGEITAIVDDGSPESIVLSGISSGAYVMSLALDTGTLTFTVGVNSDTTSVGTVTNNTNDWVWNENNVMPYVDYIKMNSDSTTPVTIGLPTSSMSATSWAVTDCSGDTMLDFTYPISADGYITSFNYKSISGFTGLKVGIFKQTVNSPVEWICTDSEYIGNASGGTIVQVETINGLSLVASAGEYVGFYCDTGDLYYILGFGDGNYQMTGANYTTIGDILYPIAEVPPMDFNGTGFASAPPSVISLNYQPNSIIAGNVLPDLDATEDGVITWGANVSGIAITNSVAPSVSTLAADNITPTTATLHGNLDSLGGYPNAVVSFEYGLESTPQTYPNTVNVTPALTAPQPFPADIANLQPNATYHFRAVASVSGLTVYGNDMSFLTTLNTTSSTTITMNKVGVFQDYNETGDLLFAAEIFCNLPPYNADSAFKSFNIQLMDLNDTTILAVAPLQMWGDRPESIYINSTIASTLVLNGAYHIQLVGLFDGAVNPYIDYTIKPSDWYGTDKVQLDAWCIQVAKNMEIYDKQVGNYVVTSTDNGEVITETAGASGQGQGAGGYFTTGIPLISSIRPDLFQMSTNKPTLAVGTADNQYDANHVWQNQVGTQIASDFNAFGKLFYNDSNHGKIVMGYILLLIAICLCVFGIMMGGKALPLLVLSFPLIMWGNTMGAVGIQWLVVPCIAMVLLWARQFWVKPT